MGFLGEEEAGSREEREEVVGSSGLSLPGPTAVWHIAHELLAASAWRGQRKGTRQWARFLSQVACPPSHLLPAGQA